MTTLHHLENHHEFHARHIGPSDTEIDDMLAVVGAPSLDALVDAIVPASIKLTAPLALPAAVTEEEALAKIRAIAQRNRVFRSFIGQGYSGTVTPKVILRNILENPAWYTAYTPYQAEISQGRMEALINFQTMVADLTGMEIANASLLDEGTAAAEAMTLARRSARSRSKVFIVAGDCHPQSIEVIRTRAEPLGIEVKVGFAPELMKTGDYFGVLAQYPATDGLIHDMRPFVEQAHAAGALFCVATDLLALTLLEAPGTWGADIVVGNSQRFGVPFGFGGPHAAFLACKDAFKRSMPGRLVGVSIDSQGQPAYRLTLQTREQHIRREKATSNICTAQVLLAVMASMYAVYHGPDGLTRIARRVHRLTSILAEGLRRVGLQVNGSYLRHDHGQWGRCGQGPRGRARGGHQPARLSRCRSRRARGLDGRHRARRNRDARRRAGAVATLRRRRRCRCARPRDRRRARGRDPGGPAPHDAVPDASGVQRASQRARDAALHALARRQGSRARPHDDSARLVHDETQCHQRNDSGDLAGIREHPSAGPGGPVRGLSTAARRTRADAGRVHRLRRGQPATQFGRAGRVCGAAGDPRLSPLRAAKDIATSA